MATGDPTGDDLCSGTTNGDTLPTDSFEERTITLSSSASLLNGKKYAIVVRAPSSAAVSSCRWYTKYSNKYSGGVSGASTDSGVTWSQTGLYDYWFSTDQESYNPTDSSVYGSFGKYIWAFQTFTATSNYSISQVILKLKKASSIGTITVGIRNVVGETYLPSKATNPTPANAADDITLDQASISWEDGGGATSYNVYYGENEAGLTLVSAGQAGTSFTLTGIDYGSPFDYVISRTWRIDSINDAGTTTGDVWTFTTISFDPPLPTGVTLDAEGEPTGTPTGENVILTVKRLVAAAENAFFYEDV